MCRRGRITAGEILVTEQASIKRTFAFEVGHGMPPCVGLRHAETGQVPPDRRERGSPPAGRPREGPRADTAPPETPAEARRRPREYCLDLRWGTHGQHVALRHDGGDAGSRRVVRTHDRRALRPGATPG